MTQQTISFPGISLIASEGWLDITEQLEDKEKPFTIANPKTGVGALQFSIAAYHGGKEPHPTLDDLSTMLDEFAANHNLGRRLNFNKLNNDIYGVDASFHCGKDLIRLWYLSNGLTILFVTYTCDWHSRELEEHEVDRMVQTIRIQ
jgi:hypothetical protein